MHSVLRNSLLQSRNIEHSNFVQKVKNMRLFKYFNSVPETIKISRHDTLAKETKQILGPINLNFRSTKTRIPGDPP